MYKMKSKQTQNCNVKYNLSTVPQPPPPPCARACYLDWTRGHNAEFISNTIELSLLKLGLAAMHDE